MTDMMGRAALVTGGGSGIGRATCIALAVRGAHVWVTDFDEPSARGTVEIIEQAGGTAEAFRLDVAVEDDWVATLTATDARAGGLHILVNCAGKSIIADTFSMPIKDARRILTVNVEGTFLGMKHTVPRIARTGGGAVINMSSALSVKAAARMAVYCGSKAAIRAMTQAVALECAELKNGVRVNSVHPGVVDTPAWHKHSADEVATLSEERTHGTRVLEVNDVARQIIPLGSPATSEEIAETVCFLASDGARHITGAGIMIDGGMTA